MASDCRLQPIEREREGHLPSKTHTFECQDHGLSHWAKDIGWTRPPDYLERFFIARNWSRNIHIIGMSTISLDL